ncbi:hypothetical protein LPW26_01745 [Rhodopseudomonas sp. HC1]|uniref:hypothetical protein n=1 Tax=Rhodopseudomonas infernalis TaxID=2897386 RepID=UPI001EE7D124|nr:hypothetical protein [Rhodopseudomonas infernalis]MCG6203348.1 hypothetical protein [Rhodopseudomonas infernalis]
MANANIVVNIAVDVNYVYSQKPGSYLGAGIYMMDNHVVSGSSGEGTLELTVAGSAGQSVAFNAFAINQLQGTNAVVTIQGLQQSSGTNVFGNQGWPSAQTPPAPYQFLGYLMKSGQMTYQIKIGVSPNGVIFPTQYYTWDPFFKVGTNLAFQQFKDAPRLWADQD